MNPVTSEELLQEQSLLDVYRAARALPVSRFNQRVTGFVCIVLVLYVWFSPESAHALAEKTRTLADYSFSFATSILSFLIAGFTIYLSVTKLDLLLLLASVRNEKTELPEIKQIAFYFVRTLVHYVLFCLLCVVIKLFASSGGLLSLLIFNLPNNPFPTTGAIAGIGFVLVGTLLIHMLMLLQSFVFNIYKTAMLSVVWERELRNKQ